MYSISLQGDQNADSVWRQRYGTKHDSPLRSRPEASRDSLQSLQSSQQSSK